MILLGIIQISGRGLSLRISWIPAPAPAPVLTTFNPVQRIFPKYPSSTHLLRNWPILNRPRSWPLRAGISSLNRNPWRTKLIPGKRFSCSQVFSSISFRWFHRRNFEFPSRRRPMCFRTAVPDFNQDDSALIRDFSGGRPWR